MEKKRELLKKESIEIMDKKLSQEKSGEGSETTLKSLSKNQSMIKTLTIDMEKGRELERTTDGMNWRIKLLEKRSNSTFYFVMVIAVVLLFILAKLSFTATGQIYQFHYHYDNEIGAGQGKKF